MSKANIFSKLFTFTKEMVNDYIEDDALNLGAALAYYTVFSFAPILVVATSIAGYFFGRDAISGKLGNELSDLLGQEAAEALQGIVSNAYVSGDSLWGTLIGVGTLLFAATGVFTNLKTSLNKIWEIRPTPTNGIVAFIKTKVLSFSFVVGLGFLLMITLVLNAIVIGFMDKLVEYIPAIGPTMLGVTTWVFSTVVTTVIFVLLFRFLPDARARWKDLWAGALFTALLFGLGRVVIGFYIGNSDFSSTYGAAGALITLLIWTYYNSQILFLGAEFTQTWARWRGNPILPTQHAVKIVRQEVELKTDKVQI